MLLTWSAALGVARTSWDAGHNMTKAFLVRSADKLILLAGVAWRCKQIQIQLHVDIMRTSLCLRYALTVGMN
jgi:hypothetical protein